MVILLFALFLETYTPTITDLRTETTSKTSFLVESSLSETNFCDSLGLFSLYIMFGEYEYLAGTTREHFFDILEQKLENCI